MTKQYSFDDIDIILNKKFNVTIPDNVKISYDNSTGEYIVDRNILPPLSNDFLIDKIGKDPIETTDYIRLLKNLQDINLFQYIIQPELVINLFNFLGFTKIMEKTILLANPIYCFKYESVQDWYTTNKQSNKLYILDKTKLSPLGTIINNIFELLKYSDRDNTDILKIIYNQKPITSITSPGHIVNPESTRSFGTDIISKIKKRISDNICLNIYKILNSNENLIKNADTIVLKRKHFLCKLDSEFYATLTYLNGLLNSSIIYLNPHIKQKVNTPINNKKINLKIGKYYTPNKEIIPNNLCKGGRVTKHLNILKNIANVKFRNGNVNYYEKIMKLLDIAEMSNEKYYELIDEILELLIL